MIKISFYSSVFFLSIRLLLHKTNNFSSSKMSTLDDKLLGEKTQNYCSSSSDDDGDADLREPLVEKLFNHV
jgi:hypothetical protein